MTPTREEWRPVVGYEGLYEASDLGRVRSLDRLTPCRAGKLAHRRGRVLQQHISKRWGRANVSLAKDGDHKTKQVAPLVLEAFVGARPEGHVCCHGEGGQLDNRLSNLRWDTQSENILDSVMQGTHHMVRRTHCPRGHSLAAPNVAPGHARRGHRTCLACVRALAARRKAKLHGEPFDLQRESDRFLAEIMSVA